MVTNRRSGYPLSGLENHDEGEPTMGISFSLLLAAAGAVLIWAVNTTSSGFNIHTAGGHPARVGSSAL